MSTTCDGTDNRSIETVKKKKVRFQEIKATVPKTNGDVETLDKTAHAVNNEPNGSLRTEL